ncbi:DUF452 family protein [Rhodobacter capsulatus]|uniref:pimeloyl-ACP methyl esterase BioG family protein n=1 Tax=Rhodobacter capsulatus TaxID=1061 RepID=UPI0006DC0102|nr:pimeloyl-ACP methyl esterase BioG family protein [Rhodobacter capsulatus]KQB15384.1 hypothetical protein AP073_13740 [Rhodobacter capsulatus]KQB16563.1 hypothetical protein AP071_11345 [Rhodobacter capsulatus]PZX22262.1 biotin synthesis protein BioG [Rhodobacter capsulatus]QNR63087.1 DUF452 family protein [Rhodobacter capsulatus]
MRADWLRRRGGADLILVFAGWAVGLDPLRHLTGAADVLVLSDYRDETLPEALWASRSRLNVVAYSMGVAVAARHLPRLRHKRAVAICGAPDPRAVIGPAIYDATLAGLSPRSLDQFSRRAGATVLPGAEIAALAAELHALASRPAAPAPAFDRILAATGDRIFPRATMATAWPGAEIDWIAGGHSPFARWRDWQEITG